MTVRVLIVCGGSGINLLGQRSVLGVDAEIQIDASKEIVAASRPDPRSKSVKLDQGVGTTGFLFDEMRHHFDRSRLGAQEIAPGDYYVAEAPTAEQDIRHFEFLTAFSPSNIPLERGLAQAPAIGGLTIRHPSNRTALEHAFEDAFAGLGLGPENPVEAWIVSSTSGGTGEGTHRFVGAFLADYVRRRHPDTPVTLNFIRVGQLTYRSVNFRRTALNTFFGLAADAAFALKMSAAPGVVSQMRAAPGVVPRWFYVDLPDVGTGDRSITVRAQLVEMAAKAVMIEDLQDDLQRLLVNNTGIPMIVTRTGYWGRDFGERRKYYETLRQLRDQLRTLLSPDYEKIVGGGERRPQFYPQDSLENWKQRAGDRRNLQRRLEEGWKFPGPKSRTYPQDLFDVREMVRDWKEAMGRLLGESWETAQGEWRVERIRIEAGQEHREMAPLRIATVGDVKFGEGQWFQRIHEAHEARAWARYLLGCDMQTGAPRRGGRENLIEKLLNMAGGISSSLHGFNPWKGTEARVRESAGNLEKFLDLLAQVDVLLSLEDDARQLLEGELSGAREVMEVADTEFERERRAVSPGGSEVVLAAELWEPLERATGETWLQLLREAARRGDREAFAQVVRRGATGLTEAGLRDVLGLRPQASIADIHLEMATRMGRMYDPDGKEFQAPWWAARTATPTMSYEYRILPRLKPEVQTALEMLPEAQKAPFRYVFTQMGQIGLYVLAFSGISLNRAPGDTVSMPAFLMSAFTASVKEALRRWEEEPQPGMPSGQLDLVLAGVGGEPLYRRALKGAGLEDEEIEKIGHFYQLYDPQARKPEEQARERLG